MTMRPTMLALAALLTCSACADKPTTSRANLTVTTQQYSQMTLGELIVPTQMARVSNQNLIMMR